MATPKQELRKTLRKQLAALPPETYRDEGKRGAGFMAGYPAWRDTDTVLLFLSAPGEIETDPLLDLAFSQGKKVFLPRVEGEIARFFHIRSAEGPWSVGAFDIREPLIDEHNPPEEFPAPGKTGKSGGAPALVVVPGMAFDRQGNRMGHGKGYYDRFFAKLDDLKIPYGMVGFCLEQQVLPDVPVEPWDKKMHAICTGTGLFTIL
ncbi:5-formyltetrahydrofolate cyclo-ligase [Treponema primitia ZAS-2]|uniref:5-formyltetrahydrofolate cyclo-ligase n=1 Tax=Treponema primitia (strain ATCC BAA-887 / DSM 12427 / ZAS-2) TaxID=545694 RepID=F5YIP8_TREPZ|nr:5-formyltetrahydrofolate cyclo-ligase [Treponema primitia]AEF84008.1 5-formyltetrahydrofolate cyclo-ligase [Treponema primitia ZAS-2]